MTKFLVLPLNILFVNFAGITVSKSGDMAYVFQSNQITMDDSFGKPMTQYNKSVSIWKKQADGTWKDAVDIWNSDPAQPGKN